MIESFNSFAGESKRSDVAGIAIVLARPNELKKILLVHATGSSWRSPVLGIPKGQIEINEEPEAAAFRECYEEIGIAILPSQVEPSMETVQVYAGSKFRNNIHYLICKIQDPAEIGLSSERVPKAQLQLEEIDWAGFVDLEEAYSTIVASQRIILDRLR